MIRMTSARRRVVLQALAGLVLVAPSVFAFGAATDVDAPDKARPDKAGGEDSSAKGAAAKRKGAVLTVFVTGNGEPIRLAEVQFTHVGGASTVPTDKAGEVTFKSAGLGAAKVRVIATGWESVLREVVLKEGSQRVAIELNSLQETKQAAGGKSQTDVNR